MRFWRDDAGEYVRFNNNYSVLIFSPVTPEKAAISSRGTAPAQIMGDMLRPASEVSPLHPRELTVRASDS